VATQAQAKPYSSSPTASSQQKSLSFGGAKRSYFTSAVGTKVLVGATGLLLFLYLILHIAGNLLVFFGPATFNTYSHMLISNPLVVPVEIGLVAVFILHVYKAVTNYVANRRARPVRYYQPTKRFFGWGWARHTSRKSLASTTMIFSGLVVLVFVVIHVMQFKYGPEYVVAQATPGEAGAVRDLYRLEVENFSNVANVVFYMFAVAVVGSHLWHGISSAFNSLGADHPRYTPWVLRIGRVVAVLIAGGFLVIPLWVYFFGVTQ
jgi:succinate dehydrogenase / fumarate reductase cytochrome b subunit